MVSDKRSKQALNKHQITQAAVELLDEAGLSGLSTRKLADRLGVRSPTLYWHVRNKADLLDLVAEAICADAFAIDESLPWQAQLADGLRQFRALLLRHRDAATLLRMRPPVGKHRLGHIETTVRILLNAGFSTTDAAVISRLLAAHVLSSVEQMPASADADTQETGAWAGVSPEEFPNLSRVAPTLQSLTGQDLFDIGVEVIIDGLTKRLADQAQATDPPEMSL